jgi:predicted dehydrogenase
VAAICDLDPDSLARARTGYPGLRVMSRHADLLADPAVDAVAVATPVSTHFDIALAALQAGKHVWIEKPLTPTSDQAARLCDEADRRGLTLMVDHTFVYTSAVRSIRSLLEAGELGDIQYCDAVRTSLGRFQSDVSVLWDLAAHDLSILDLILPERPVGVSATGLAHLDGERENIAYLTLFFDGRLIAHIHASWLAPVKVRRLLIGGSRRMIVYDDLEPSEKVKVYDAGIRVEDNAEQSYQMRIGYRRGDMWAPRLDVVEALRVATAHFVGCVKDGQRPLTDGEAGLRVVRLLEAAGVSLASRGRPVSLRNQSPL